MTQTPLRVGCFGKLPLWPEYLDVGGTLPTSRALKRWLHAARAEAGLGEDGEDRPSREDVKFHAQLRLLLGLPGSTELLAGVLRPSKGGGGREFPFAVFTHLVRRSYGRSYPLLPLGLAAVWDELEAAWDSLASVASKAAFDEVLESLQVPHPPPVRAIQGEFDRMLQEPALGLYHHDDGTPRRDPGEIVPPAMVRIGGRRGKSGVNVTLPLSADLETACFEAGLWVNMLNRQFLMRRIEPNLLLDARRSSSDRQVLLRIGDLEPSDYAAVSQGSWLSSHAAPPRDADEHPRSAPGVQVPTYGDLLRQKFPRSKTAAPAGRTRR